MAVIHKPALEREASRHRPPVETAARRRRLRAAALHDISGWVLAVPALVCLLVFEWQPLLVTVKNSFYNMTGFNATSFAGAANYQWVLQNPEFLTVFVNTVKYVGWSFVIGYSLPIIMAIIISELPHFRGFFRICVYIPTMVPIVIASLMWTELYSASSSGIVNRFLQLVGLPRSELLLNPHLTILLIVISTTWSGFGATTILYTAGLSGINRALYEAAVLDGAGYLSRAWHITLPQLRKLMGLFFILQLVGVFQILVQPLVMTAGGPDLHSESILLFTYNLAFEFYRTADADAVGAIAFAVLLIVTSVYVWLNFRQPSART